MKITSLERNQFYLLVSKIQKNQLHQKTSHFGSFVNEPQHQIKALTALEGRLSLSVGCENGPEKGLKTISCNPEFPVI